MLPAGSAPEDGRNYRPKHDELIEIINKIIIVVSSWLFVLYYGTLLLFQVRISQGFGGWICFHLQMEW